MEYMIMFGLKPSKFMWQIHAFCTFIFFKKWLHLSHLSISVSPGRAAEDPIVESCRFRGLKNASSSSHWKISTGCFWGAGPNFRQNLGVVYFFLTQTILSKPLDSKDFDSERFGDATNPEVLESRNQKYRSGFTWSLLCIHFYGRSRKLPKSKSLHQ